MSSSASPDASGGTNASRLYERISADAPLTQELFRRALQDPKGAMDQICAIGDELGLPVTAEEVRLHIDSLEDMDTKRWINKARGGL
ncbi:hypothetical protein EVJ50_12670 [Synechococcus sp. RSCCF101]|uniref:hypothetical protein n=1 Tax=Synechococcus sp. RSCCF101 TaxID=2511069 RepID=UPI0012486213|nr:hypothetical protein [Synechococcus sp. RSCCF101]QEY32951.1 hypothetical protein EVJ50_12670 [Synechococcus sp. RSCCF101]